MEGPSWKNREMTDFWGLATEALPFSAPWRWGLTVPVLSSPLPTACPCKHGLQGKPGCS